MSAALNMWLKSVQKQLERKTGRVVTVCVRASVDVQAEVEWVCIVHFYTIVGEGMGPDNSFVFPKPAAASLEELISSGINYLDSVVPESVSA